MTRSYLLGDNSPHAALKSRILYARGLKTGELLGKNKQAGFEGLAESKPLPQGIGGWERRTWI